MEKERIECIYETTYNLSNQVMNCFRKIILLEDSKLLFKVNNTIINL
jgi:hypothetical protein